MKTSNLIKLTVVTGALMTLTAQASILGTKHDFSGSVSWNNDPADPATVCSVCHTPHNADDKLGPLWSHSNAGHTYTMYNSIDSPGFGVKASIASKPAATSLACLSCHDGAAAYNVYGPNGGTQHGPTALTITNNARIAPNGNLTHTHPISLNYQAAITAGDKWLNDPSASVLTPVDQAFVAANTTSIADNLLDGSGNVECSSCHDVHNQIGTPYNSSKNPNLLKINGTDAFGVGSLLCRSCHNK